MVKDGKAIKFLIFMYILYYNENCSKSRICRSLLEKENINFEIKEYMKHNLKLDEIKNILFNLGDPIRNIFRTNEMAYREKITSEINNYDFKFLLSFLHKNQICIQRPIFFDAKIYKICRPPELILQLINKPYVS